MTLSVIAPRPAMPPRFAVFGLVLAGLRRALRRRTLSKLRAQVLADRLATQGVDRGRIALRPKGSVGGDPGIESRQVEMNID